MVPRIVSKILLLVVTTTILLFVAEGAVRILGLAPGFGAIEFGQHAASEDPILGWTNSKSAPGMNSLGLRGPELRNPRDKKGTPRILFLGDSIAFGYGLEADQTIEQKLESRLKGRGIDAEVLNAGVVAYNSIQEGRWLEVYGGAIEPDQVVVLYCLNDTTRLPGDAVPEDLMREANKQGRKDDWARTKSLPKLSPFQRAVLTHSHLIRVLYYRFIDPPPLPVAGNKAVSGKGWSEDFSVVEDGFGRIARYCAKAKIPATVAIVPWLEHLDNYPNKKQHETVAKIAMGLGLRVVDLLPPFAEHFKATGRSTAQPGDPVHPDAEGSEVAAAALADALIPLLKGN